MAQLVLVRTQQNSNYKSHVIQIPTRHISISLHKC